LAGVVFDNPDAFANISPAQELAPANQRFNRGNMNAGKRHA
jgi:hypothetical protein